MQTKQSGVNAMDDESEECRGDVGSATMWATLVLSKNSLYGNRSTCVPAFVPQFRRLFPSQPTPVLCWLSPFTVSPQLPAGAAPPGPPTVPNSEEACLRTTFTIRVVFVFAALCWCSVHAVQYFIGVQYLFLGFSIRNNIHLSLIHI